MTTTAPLPAPAARLPVGVRAKNAAWRTYHFVFAWIDANYTQRDPTFKRAFASFLAVTSVLFTRWPGTNFIFDEQEALLGNPYVNATSGLRFGDAIHRDFWGLPPDRSIGSYRPIPDFVWRAIWQLSSKPDGIFRQPFVHQVYNVVFHALNAAILTRIVWSWTRRRGPSWLAGLAFATSAVLTEAVTGIVGIADVLGGLGAVVALAALALPAYAMPFGVFLGVAFGLFAKESAIVCVPLVPFAALLVAPLVHPERPARLARMLLAFVGGASAFVLYVELRRRWFPSPLPKELTEWTPDLEKPAGRLVHDFMVWFHQAPLPKDALNNPLVKADKAHRIAGALRVYARGLGQVVWPWTLSGDYSFPQEPVPERLVFPASVIGAILMIAPPFASLILWVDALFREKNLRRRSIAWSGPREATKSDAHARLRLRVAGLAVTLFALCLWAIDLLVLHRKGMPPVALPAPLWAAAFAPGAIGLGLLVESRRAVAAVDPRPLQFSGRLAVAVALTWVVVSYFPHSNIPVVLPTVRAERFWYFPAIGTSILLGVAFVALAEAVARRRLERAWLLPIGVFAFFAFQSVQAYRHAADYRSDVDFWRATKDAVPRSAKAHLNYSVMKGARSDLETRLVESKIAMELAPDWAMAHIYTGDTLCRMHRAPEAWKYYAEGFELGKDDSSLIALALGCLHDENELMVHEAEIRKLADKLEGSWFAYIALDTLENHEKNNGVAPKYRPRGYNEGPKE